MRYAIWILSFFIVFSDSAAAQVEWTDSYKNQIISRLSSGSAQEVLDELLTLSGPLTEDAEYSYWLGVVRAALGKKHQAFESFERAVLIDPRHAGAWLELGLLYADSGDLNTATLVLDHVEQQFQPNFFIRKKIEDLRRGIAYQLRFSGQPKWAADVEIGFGHVSNVNMGLEKSDFLFYGPNIDPIVVRADKSIRARSDSALRARLFAVRSESINSATNAELVVSTGVRHYPAESQFGYTDAGIWWQLNHRLSDLLELRVRPGLQYSRQKFGAVATQTGALLGVGTTLFSGCRTFVFSQPELVSPPGAAVESRVYWWGLSTDCVLVGGRGGVDLRSGVDRPSNRRLGGLSIKRNYFCISKDLWLRSARSIEQSFPCYSHATETARLTINLSQTVTAG